MPDDQRIKDFEVGPHKLRWFVIGVVCLIFVLCLWLFFDIWASRKDIQELFSHPLLSESLLKDLLNLYRQEMVLNTILGFLILGMGALAFTYISFSLRMVGRLEKIRNIDQYILESITRGVLTVSGSGEVTSCNRAFREILELHDDACNWSSLNNLFSDGDPILEMVNKALRSETQMDAEDEIIYSVSKHTNKPLRVTTCALRDDAGASLGVILLIKDLTPIKALEARLRRQERLVAIGHLTRRILHEIRNPLSAMDLNLQLLQEKLEGRIHDDQIDRHFRIVFSELHRLDSVLSSTHLSVTPPQVELRPLDLNHLLEDLIRTMEAEIQHAGHSLAAALSSEQILIPGDRDLLKEALINIIKNALEAMSGRPGRISIRTRILDDRQETVLEISDTGKGIDWQNLSRIFDPYFSTKKKGTGLGLSIVHNIVSQHKGDIQIASWVGEGTLVTLTFPLLTPEQDYEQEHPQ